MLSDRKPVVASRPSPLTVAEAFIAAYARGDADAILAMCADHASASYVPWGDTGRNPIAATVGVWQRYPAAFDDFAMPITYRLEDVEQRTAVIATLNQGRQRADVDGIVNAGRRMSCPHLFLITLDGHACIEHVQVWCDQLTLYQQLGFPTDFAVGRKLS